MERLFQYNSEIQAVPSIRRDLEELALNWGFPDSVLRQITLIIEELFSIIIRFAFDDKERHLILILISQIDQEICIEISDDGIPFNPMEYEPGFIPDPVSSDDEEWDWL